MIPNLLELKYSEPLEREYEAWTVAGIERYFRKVGRTCSIWALSPHIEKDWPSDEVFVGEGKILGLQFKRPILASATTRSSGYARLKWSLVDPPNQFETLKSVQHVYYALPTFRNRAYAARALDHCLFWRPEEQDTVKTVWYNNKSPVAKLGQLSRSPRAYRWGRVVEALQDCELGHRVGGALEAKEYIDAIIRAYSQARLQDFIGLEGSTDPARIASREFRFPPYALYVSLRNESAA